MKCAICEARKPRRYCPGVHGEICTVCCGTERENTVDCPFDCVYLREARVREKLNEFDPAAFAKIPFNEIRVPERFLHEQRDVAMLVFNAVVDAIFATPGVIDSDVREALEALIQTHKTRQSGLVYESRPGNPVAANVYERIQSHVEEHRKEMASRTGVSVRDADIMAALLLLQRQGYHLDNGRKRGRAYIDHLRTMLPDRAASMNPATSPLIL